MFLCIFKSKYSALLFVLVIVFVLLIEIDGTGHGKKRKKHKPKPVAHPLFKFKWEKAKSKKVKVKVEKPREGKNNKVANPKDETPRTPSPSKKGGNKVTKKESIKGKTPQSQKSM